MSSGKRPICVLHRGNCHGVPRRGWAQAGTYHSLPLHWWSVTTFLYAFSVFCKQSPQHLPMLVFSPSPFCFSSFIFSTPARWPVFYAKTLCPTMLFPLSLNHFLITSHQTFPLSPLLIFLISFQTSSLSRCIACISFILLQLSITPTSIPNTAPSHFQFFPHLSWSCTL